MAEQAWEGLALFYLAFAGGGRRSVDAWLQGTGLTPLRHGAAAH